MFAEIEEIMTGNYKITEKLRLLNELKIMVNQEIEESKEEIKKGFKYCEHCKEYYKEKSWEEEYKRENRNICISSGWAEFDDYEYKEKGVIVKYDICPMGHKIEKSCTELN